ncbi:hypothetical protein [Sphingomonas sp. OK281]|uniref:hypothetical protein n=1 Tax=Sphingomonas sp. OK281 TaxID=1881067 RepID=UPI0008E9B9ED|nr:hypothetical protein [Sphingomonas sp. OK281]SFO02325.1 hypothetical protein SAMN05428984_1683 [Sphingomonas sp. OK281]
MSSWRDVAAAVAQRQQPAAGPTAIETFGLPDDLAAALRRLETMPPPRKLERSANWRGVVADAMTIARDRWAAKAMALGWTAGDLFGIGPRDDWDFQGLAVWLSSRRIVMLDAERVIVAGDSGDHRSTFERGGMRHGTHPTITPVMLWDFGR